MLVGVVVRMVRSRLFGHGDGFTGKGGLIHGKYVALTQNSISGYPISFHDKGYIAGRKIACRNALLNPITDHLDKGFGELPQCG
jgi:hypothetical protein